PHLELEPAGVHELGDALQGGMTAASLEPGDGRLRGAHPLGQLRLGHACSPSGLPDEVVPSHGRHCIATTQYSDSAMYLREGALRAAGGSHDGTSSSPGARTSAPSAPGPPGWYARLPPEPDVTSSSPGARTSAPSAPGPP